MPPRPTRLRSIRFPAALEWLRTEDVIRMAAAGSGAGPSRKAFFNRWPTREEFLPDAVVYALVDDPLPEPPNEQAREVHGTAASPVPFSQEVIRIADGLLASLQRHPRSYLTLHIGPLLAQDFVVLGRAAVVRVALDLDALDLRVADHRVGDLGEQPERLGEDHGAVERELDLLLDLDLVGRDLHQRLTERSGKRVPGAGGIGVIRRPDAEAPALDFTRLVSSQRNSGGSFPDRPCVR